ncbi:TetR/AcrR family transcriptional regulator [Pseudoduganella sp. SL102]|uniref:TetR/AcrR family transcriptional regulator n=1 Tax=Pseudoduganella sp. SL102 TaxID=2995154 RepID=UPI00248B7A3A|nr:TetR/AcrR family transcriptional regulator [Pseudoduganella sp. SL102]WBS01135.1 TetR/AcrR family transcriptional regulator [Pseudoduganella sp. SL102]
MNGNGPKRGRGRPRKLECRETLLEAGRDLLLSHGLRMTVDAVALRAKVAKTTFYTYFQDKEAFIEAVMLRESARTMSDEEYRAAIGGDLREVLVGFGVRYLSFANENRLAAWDRVITSANDLYPELAARLYEAGPGRVYTMLAEILRQAAQGGTLRIPDTMAAAEELAGIWYGHTILRVNLKIRCPLSAGEIRQRAERGVDLLYRLYG